MSTLSLRLPESMHRQLKELAAREGVSINQLINSAVAEKALPSKKDLWIDLTYRSLFLRI